MDILRWGILGTADIAKQNWRAIFDSGNSVVTAVASRSIERSDQFVNACQTENQFEIQPKAYGNYHELIDALDIDAIYIPLPTGLRKDWVLRAAKAGKHVLCEKPCGLSMNDVQDMIDTCRQNKVQFMDGVMFMHNPRLERIREVLNDGKSIGKIKRISSMFSFNASAEFQRNNIRLHSELEPTGCLGDLGWYNIRFSLWTMNWQLPHTVTGRIISQQSSNTSPSPTPTDFSGELFFDDNVSADFYCSFLTAQQQWSIISGTKGSLQLSDFVHPINIHESTFGVNDSEVSVKCCDCKSEHTESRAQAQDTRMIRRFANQILSGKSNEDWPMMSLKTQQVMDACFKSAQQDGKAVKI
jgi:predicted dehydrogenase